MQLANTARALHDTHLATGEARRAAEIATTVRAQLASVSVPAPARDVDQQAAAAVRLARQGQAPLRAPNTPNSAPGPASPPRPRGPELPGRSDPER